MNDPTQLNELIDELATMRNDICAIADRLAEIKGTLPSWYSDQLDLPLSHVADADRRLGFVVATFRVESSTDLLPQSRAAQILSDVIRRRGLEPSWTPDTGWIDADV